MTAAPVWPSPRWWRAGLAFPTMALAQMPPEIAAKVAALGRVVDPENTAKFYTPLQEKEPYAGIKVVRDVKYGAHDRNVVDIFTPETGAAGRPVLMFVHGGGYIRGNKRPPGSAFYDNVMVFAARHGMVGVNVEYRLAPEFPVAGRRRGHGRGGALRHRQDRELRRRSQPRLPDGPFGRRGPRGGLRVASGILRAEGLRARRRDLLLRSFLRDQGAGARRNRRVAYFGADTSRYAERAALPGLLKTNIPFMMSRAELDPPAIAEQFVTLKDAHVQVGARLRAQHRAAQAQPHVGVLRDQHGGYPALRPDSRIHQDREIAPSAANGTFTIALTR